MKDNPEIMSLIYKYGLVCSYIGIGLLGIFGLDMVTGKKISIWYIVGTSFGGVCVGWLSWRMCQKYALWDPGIVVPIATLVSRDFLIFIRMVNWKVLFAKLLKVGVKTDE